MSVRYVVEVRFQDDEFARKFAFKDEHKAVALKSGAEARGGWASQIYTRPTADLMREMGYS